MIQDSIGPKRSFTITIGLKEGYHLLGKLHKVEELMLKSTIWMKNRTEDKKPYLPGMWRTADICYVYDEKEVWEPVAIFSGEVNHLYNSYLKDWEVEIMLNELASFLGSTTNQTRIYLTFCDKMWILEKEVK